MSDGGKGSKPRPLSVPDEEFNTRWDAIFSKKQREEAPEDDHEALSFHPLPSSKD